MGSFMKAKMRRGVGVKCRLKCDQLLLGKEVNDSAAHVCELAHCILVSLFPGLISTSIHVHKMSIDNLKSAVMKVCLCSYLTIRDCNYMKFIIRAYRVAIVIVSIIEQ